MRFKALLIFILSLFLLKNLKANHGTSYPYDSLYHVINLELDKSE
jgi:hypothetical protein